MKSSMEELNSILKKFADSGWELIAAPSRDWLNGKSVQNALTEAIREADRQCGSCGCEFDHLYKRALELLGTI